MLIPNVSFLPRAALALLAATASTAAQDVPAPADTAPKTMVAQMDARFANTEPKAGQPLPDAAGVDRAGAPWRLSSTRGKLTVLVTGCLT